MQFDPREVPMGDLTSRVPELLAERGWAPIDLIRRGLTYNAAYKVARGDTAVTLRTAAQLCAIFGLTSLDEIFRYAPSAEQENRG